MKQNATQFMSKTLRSEQSPRKFRITARLVLAIMTGILYLSTTSCGNKKTTDGTSTSGSYSTYQQIFCLNMLSDISGAYNGHYGDTILDSTRYAIKTTLGNTQVQQLIGNWKCIWGPVVYTSPGTYTAPEARNTMYMAQNLDSPSLYVIAIAGTDFSSLYDWFDEDFNVLSFKYWDSVVADVCDTFVTRGIKPQIGHPFVSAATARGLANLMCLKDSTLPDTPTLQAFLTSLSASVAQQSNKKITIWTTGHSLGGALSPALAFYLQQTTNIWASTNSANVSINCLAVAGATPGDYFFHTAYAKNVPNTIRIWNARDVVPHGFGEAMLYQIPTIYDSINLPAPYYVDSIVKITEAAVLLYNYYQLYPQSDTMFTSEFYDSANALPGNNGRPDTSYFDQVLCQHVPSYPHFFGVDSFQTAVQKALGLKYPFFSGGYSPAAILSKQLVKPPFMKK